jgi:hypothetical protein
VNGTLERIDAYAGHWRGGTHLLSGSSAWEEVMRRARTPPGPDRLSGDECVCRFVRFIVVPSVLALVLAS